MESKKGLVISLLILCVVIAVVPLIINSQAEFGGSDDAAGGVIEEIEGEYEPWFTPIAEQAIGGEIPGEIESLLFCIQTGIGVGIIAFLMGRFVQRKKDHPDTMKAA